MGVWAAPVSEKKTGAASLESGVKNTFDGPSGDGRTLIWVAQGMDLFELPFIRRSPGGRLLWSPPDTGDYAKNVRAGETGAQDFMIFVHCSDFPYSLGQVITALSQSKQPDNGYQVGFFSEIQKRLTI